MSDNKRTLWKRNFECGIYSQHIPTSPDYRLTISADDLWENYLTSCQTIVPSFAKKPGTCQSIVSNKLQPSKYLKKRPNRHLYIREVSNFQGMHHGHVCHRSLSRSPATLPATQMITRMRPFSRKHFEYNILYTQRRSGTSQHILTCQLISRIP